MKKDFTVNELKAKLTKAEANYNRCGCRIYKEEADALKKRIAELEKT